MIFSISDLAKARALQGHIKFHGLDIAVENAKGSVRKWKDRKGYEGQTTMKLPYGYIRGVLGADGDALDVFVGPKHESTKVFVVNQRRWDDFKKFDEHKCMVGFDSKEEAKAAYLKHYDKPDFLGSIVEMTMERFKKWIADGREKTEPIRKALFIGPRGGKWADAAHTIPWKPETAKPEAHAKLQEKPKAPYSEEQFVSGEFEKDPDRWPFFHILGAGQPPVGWAKGGVDPHSKHPVKEAGFPGKLFQIVDPEADKGWARIRDLHTGDTKLVQHDRVYPVFYQEKKLKPKVEKPPIEGPKWSPTDRPKPPPIVGTSEKASHVPIFKGSQAKPGTVLHMMENGHFLVTVAHEYETDASGEPHVVKRRKVIVDNALKTKLVSEFEGMLANVAKQTQRGFKLPKRALVSGGREQDQTLIELRSAALEGFLHAIDTYRGDASFAKHARFVARDYAAMHAAGEFSGISISRRHARALRSFIVARAAAIHETGKDSPSPKEIAAHWKLKKRHVHPDISKEQGREDVPMGSYKLKAEVDGETVESPDKPGKAELAERYHEFLAGQANVLDEESIATLPDLGIGLGLSAEDKLVIRDQLSKFLAKHRDYETTIGTGRRRVTYRVDAAQILDRTLGLSRDRQPTSQIVTEVPIERKVEGEWKRLGPRQATEVIQHVLDDLLTRAKHAMGEHGKLVEQAQERLLPLETAKPGPTYGQILEARSRGVSVAQTRAWRKDERARLKTLAARIRERAATMTGSQKDVQLALAEATAGAARRVDRMGDREVKLRIARQLAPETAEMRRLATKTVSVDQESPGIERGWAVVTMTDLSSGQQRRVRIRTFKDLRDPENREWTGTFYQKANAGVHPLNDGVHPHPPTTGMIREVLKFPLLMRHLWGEDDIPTAERFALESMVGLA